MNENITKKDSYLMYKNWSKSIQKLSDEQAGQLIKAICSLQEGEETDPEDIAVSVLYEIIKQKMQDDADAYKAKCDRLVDNFSSQKGNENSQKGKNISQKGNLKTQLGNENSQKGNLKTQMGKNKSQLGNEKTQMGNFKTQMGNKKSQLGCVATDTDSLSISDTDTDTLSDTDSKDIKESYGENGNVKLTVKERERLISDYGYDLTEQAIDYLDGYIADKGYKSKSNYQAIRRWVIDAVKEKPRGKPEKFDIDAYLQDVMEGKA